MFAAIAATTDEEITMEIGELVRRAGHHHADRIAFVCGDTQMTFREFDRATDRLAHHLLALGLAPGQHVGVLLPNGIEVVVAYYALAKAGLVRVPLHPKDTPTDLSTKAEFAAVQAVLSDGQKIDGIDLTLSLDDIQEASRRPTAGGDRPCQIDRDPEAALRLGFTGGTTGRAKAVVLTTRGELFELTAFMTDLVPGIQAADVMLHAAPIAHAGGAFVLPHLISGATQVILPAFDAAQTVAFMHRYRPQRTFLVPTMISMVLDQPGVDELDRSLTRLCYGASSIAPTVRDQAMDVFGPVLAQVYGQAEAPMAITRLLPEDHTDERQGSCGRPFTLVDAAIWDDDDRPLGPGEVGEIVTRSGGLMREYWQNPEATAVTMRGGWVHTGDVGVIDADGFFSIVDRKGDMMISGGYNVYPREIEDVLLAHPAVREAAAVGIPDDRWGERVHAVVAVRSDVSPEELLSFCAERLPSRSRPRSLEIRPELPKSHAGKILRRVVRDEVANAER
jgi:acyl-CoA synthetase (AMP-forming)/AMP-acid ligase II